MESGTSATIEHGTAGYPMKRWFLILALCLPCFGQAWSGIFRLVAELRIGQTQDFLQRCPMEKRRRIRGRRQRAHSLQYNDQLPAMPRRDGLSTFNSAISSCSRLAGHLTLRNLLLDMRIYSSSATTNITIRRRWSLQ